MTLQPLVTVTMTTTQRNFVKFVRWYVEPTGITTEQTMEGSSS